MILILFLLKFPDSENIFAERYLKDMQTTSSINQTEKKWGTERLSALPKVAQATSRKIQTWVHIPGLRTNILPAAELSTLPDPKTLGRQTYLPKMIPFNSNPSRGDSRLSIPFFQVLNCMYILIMVKRKFLKNIKI